MSDNKVLEILHVAGVVTKKSTWEVTDKMADNDNYAPFIWKKVDSFIMVDKNKKEYKFFDHAWKIPLEFWDYWVLKTTFALKK